MRILQDEYYDFKNSDYYNQMSFDEYVSEYYSDFANQIIDVVRDFVKKTWGNCVWFVNKNIENPTDDDMIESYEIIDEFVSEVREYVGDMTEKELIKEFKQYIEDNNLQEVI